MTGKLGKDDITTSIDFYEVLKPSSAKVLGRFDNVEGEPPIATANDFGKGRAIYVATPAQPSVMQALYRQLYQELAINPGPTTPEGVFAREVNGRMLIVNTTTEAKEVKVRGNKNGVLTGKAYKDVVALPAYGVEVVE